MPYKLKNDRRHKFEETKYKISNWKEYEQGLKNRGSLTIWFSDDAISAWSPLAISKKKGGQQLYSDMAIETALTVRLVYKLGLRQTEGFLESISKLMNIDIKIPDHTTLSRRSNGLKLQQIERKPGEPVEIIVDSSGLKISGTGEWCQSKYGDSKKRSWKKIHIAIDEATKEILSMELTSNSVGDETVLPLLVNKIEEKVDAIIADGAYDAVNTNNIDPSILLIIPPRKDAVLSNNFEDDPTIRDEHLLLIESKGKGFWQKESGYTRRSLVENTFFRYKKVIGNCLRSKRVFSQKVEAAIGCKILNIMSKLGMPETIRI
ncbi:MAG: IS5 family transposase [Oligoflexia bacterium]|nr:IS5 family transposase [Oligoflexia bacterium]